MEEEKITSQEMIHVYTHYIGQHTRLRGVLDTDRYALSPGQHSAVLVRLLAVERKCRELCATFCPYVQVEPVDVYFAEISLWQCPEDRVDADSDLNDGIEDNGRRSDDESDNDSDNLVDGV